jgi:hypothetical protein
VPTMGNWVQTKFLEKDLQNAAKIGILKNDPAEVHIAGPEIIPHSSPASVPPRAPLCLRDSTP